MAEAVVEERPQQPQRFYCHVCSVEIQAVTSDYKCPICSDGFIEELPAPSESSSEDVEMSEPNGTDNLDMIRDELRSLLMTRAGTRPSDPDLGDDEQQGGSLGNRMIGRRNRRRPRMVNSDRFDNILLEILHTLSGGTDGTFGNASMFFMGNPGDYAWGHEGIDTIVTQLLNQMDTTGPPPLSKEKIKEIPNVEITEEQVEMKLQCSVCWEDFKLSESVRKLPCSHVYHENCIVPWLQLHGTCPICRKSLTPENNDVTNSLRNAASAFIRSSSEDSSQPTASNNSISQTNTSSSQPDLQLSDHDNILSRLFAQPGTSGMMSSGMLPAGMLPGVTMVLEHPDDPVFHRWNFNHGDSGGGGGGGGGNGSNNNGGRGEGGNAGNSTAGNNSNSSSNNRTDNNSHQTDISKYEDGNVEFDFD